MGNLHRSVVRKSWAMYEWRKRLLPDGTKHTDIKPLSQMVL